MTNYKRMYYKLFNAMTKAKEIIEEAQKQAENDFIDKPEREVNKITRGIKGDK